MLSFVFNSRETELQESCDFLLKKGEKATLMCKIIGVAL